MISPRPPPHVCRGVAHRNSRDWKPGEAGGLPTGEQYAARNKQAGPGGFTGLSQPLYAVLRSTLWRRGHLWYSFGVAFPRSMHACVVYGNLSSRFSISISRATLSHELSKCRVDGYVLVVRYWEAEAKDGMVGLGETGVCYYGWPTTFCTGRGLGSSLGRQQLCPSPFVGW